MRLTVTLPDLGADPLLTEYLSTTGAVMFTGSVTAMICLSGDTATDAPQPARRTRVHRRSPSLVVRVDDIVEHMQASTFAGRAPSVMFSGTENDDPPASAGDGHSSCLWD